MRDFRLYVILDIDICKRYGDLAQIASKIISGPVEALQLRAKSCSAGQIREVAQTIKGLIRDSQTLFIINDRVELVEIIGADGVHLGQRDLPIKKARQILGKDKIIGLSTHSIEQAQAAQTQGVDYLAIGPIFTTSLKANSTPLSPKILTEIKAIIQIPWVAVGGITLDNLNQVLAAGAQRIAVCKAIAGADDVSAAMRKFRQRLYN